MFDDHNFNCQPDSTKSVLEIMNEAMELANKERNKAVWETVGNWNAKLRKTSKNWFVPEIAGGTRYLPSAKMMSIFLFCAFLSGFALTFSTGQDSAETAMKDVVVQTVQAAIPH